ncbi:MAG: hypothetical protein J6N72_10560 [Psychrobacter sp.]|nr:hypothetical protein [Psychrobacter sp.]
MQSNENHLRSSVLANPDLILDLPVGTLSYELCQIAVTKKPSLIRNVPYLFLEIQDFKIVRLALEVDGMAIKHLDEYRIDKDMCSLASKNLKEEPEECFLSYIPYRFIDKNICIRSVKSNPCNIDYVPLKFMSAEIGGLLTSKNQDLLLDKIPLLTRKHLKNRLTNA